MSSQPSIANDTSPPFRILFIDHTSMMGGGEIALLNLARAIDRTRFTPVALLFSDGPLAAKLRESEIETHVYPLAESVLNTRKDTIGGGTLLRIADVFRALGFTWRLGRVIAGLRVSIVHTNSLKSDLIGGVAAHLAGANLIWHVRDRIASDYLPPSVAMVFRILCSVLPHRLIANSYATLGTIDPRHRDLPGSRSRFGVIHGGVIHDGTPLQSQTPHISAADSPPVVGLVGRLTRWKGQHIFLRAAATVLQRYPITRFQIIGSPMFGEEAYEAEIRALAKSLGIEANVDFLGFRSDVPELIAKLDLLVHASITGEPFGQVVIEGMNAGKPVVATNGGGVPEIVRDGVTGLLVPMGDAEAMAEAILRLLADPELALAMGRAGRARLLREFTIERTANQVQALYENLLDDDRSTAASRLDPLWPKGALRSQ